MRVYPDTSFLVSRYLGDSHSVEADGRMASRPLVVVTPFHGAELANAIFQWVFRGRISTSDAELALADFEADCAAGVWQLAGVPIRACDSCVGLPRQHAHSLGVRTLDTLHVAPALELKTSRFWTFDDRQAKLAEAEGLVTA